MSASANVRILRSRFDGRVATIRPAIRPSKPVDLLNCLTNALRIFTFTRTMLGDFGSRSCVEILWLLKTSSAQTETQGLPGRLAALLMSSSYQLYHGPV